MSEFLGLKQVTKHSCGFWAIFYVLHREVTPKRPTQRPTHRRSAFQQLGLSQRQRLGQTRQNQGVAGHQHQAIVGLDHGAGHAPH